MFFFLANELAASGAHFIFIDDLYWQRVADDFYDSKNFVHPQNFNSIFKFKNEEVVIWGSGAQSKEIVSKSLFAKSINTIKFFDSMVDKTQSHFQNQEFVDIDFLISSDVPIVIGASQSSPLYLQTGIVSWNYS